MKAYTLFEVGDYLKTENGPKRVEEIRMDFDTISVFLENGEVIAVSDISIDDVLLESEVV